MDITLTVNGRRRTVDAEDNMLLSTLLREALGLTGTHIGCDTSQCGACAVHIDGKSVKACTMLAAEAEGAAIVTIEGLARQDALHPMQQAFHENHGLQCGFCTPGMVMSAVELATINPDASEAEIRAWLTGNFCRCTGYQNIVKAVRAGAAAMKSAAQGVSHD
jgi:aerobic carbon-monoxide dehydrogenase small subunit